MAELAFVALVLSDLLLALLVVAMVLTVVNQRRGFERGQWEVENRLHRIEQLMKPADELAAERARQSEIQREKQQAFQRYGLDEGT